jgi:plasmid stability protein
MPELRITVPLSREEFVALRTRASAELRQPRDQARHILRAALLTDPPYPPSLRNESKEAPKFHETGGASFGVQS